MVLVVNRDARYSNFRTVSFVESISPLATKDFARRIRQSGAGYLMGKNITLVGGNGDGQTAKVANQIIVHVAILSRAMSARLRSTPQR
jgi:3-hydroxyisobutyrate dehydrogenase-like beta-hydroxyacid dehydrogenase